MLVELKTMVDGDSKHFHIDRSLDFHIIKRLIIFAISWQKHGLEFTNICVQRIILTPFNEFGGFSWQNIFHPFNSASDTL